MSQFLPKLATLALAVLFSAATVTAQTTNPSLGDGKAKLKAKVAELKKVAAENSAPPPDNSEITFPFEEELVFIEAIEFAYIYEFKLDKTFVLNFSADDGDIGFWVTSDPDFEDDSKEFCFEIGGGCPDLELEAGTYYVMIFDVIEREGFTANISIDAIEPFKITDIALPFSENLYFHPDYNSKNIGDEIVKVFKLDLAENTVLRYTCNGTDCGVLRIYTDSALTELIAVLYISGSISALPQGEYYLAFSDGQYNYYSKQYLTASVKLEKFAGYDFAEISKFPFMEKVDFNSETAILYGVRTILYKFELTETANLTFENNSNRRIYFELLSDSLLKDWVAGGDEFSSILPSGVYYLKVFDSKDTTDVFSTNIKITAKALEQKLFEIEEITLPFSSELYFHPDFNSRIDPDSGYIEKVFKLVLKDSTKIKYAEGCNVICSSMRIYNDKDLTDTVSVSFPWDDSFTLPQGTYYLAFNDDYSYKNDTNYISIFVKINTPAKIAFENIAIPYLKEQIDLAPSKGAARAVNEYVKGFSFTLDKDTTVYFYGYNKNLEYEPSLLVSHSEFDSWLEKVEDYYIIDSNGLALSLGSGTYYVVLSDNGYNYNKGNYYSTYFSVSFTDEKPDVTMPQEATETFTVAFNSDGGSTVAEQTIENWKFATKPADPAKVGFIFAGWYNGEELWDFANYFITGNVTLTAKWDTDTPIRTPQIAAGNIKAYALGNTIMLQNVPKNTNVQIYNLQGKRVHSRDAMHRVSTMGEMQIEVQSKGMYIVKAGRQTLRVAVK